jgi:hypothetical protein
MIAGDMQAMTDVSEMAQKLMNSFEDTRWRSWIMPTQKVRHMTRRPISPK